MPSPYSVFPHGFYDIASEVEIDLEGEETIIPLAPGEEIVVARGLDHTQTNLQGGHAALDLQRHREQRQEHLVG